MIDVSPKMLFWTLLIVSAVIAGEREEVARLAPRYEAEVEVRMPDGTRCDMLSDEWAIEVDYAPKWAEAIGQSVLYSCWTGRPPAVLLLRRGAADKAHLLRCRLVCERLKIRMFVESAQ